MRPLHPGEILLEDYIKPMGISVRALSLALHVPYSHLREIVNGNRGVSSDMALRLELYFGSEAQGWLNLQAAYTQRVNDVKANSSRLFLDDIMQSLEDLKAGRVVAYKFGNTQRAEVGDGQ